MEVRTYRAKTMQQALEQVRRELGAGAAVLHTRELNRNLLSRLVFGRQVEVAASAEVNVPSRLPPTLKSENGEDKTQPGAPPAHLDTDYRAKYREHFRRQVASQLDELQSLVGKLYDNTLTSGHQELPEALFQVFTTMIEAEIDETISRDLLEKIRNEGKDDDFSDALLVQARAARLLAEEIHTSGPIEITPGSRRLVALVGPTGVGKTTTIAKLAANFRLREKKRVGLITVDTYRVAAVEQLRTYADIIDLPMEVVATPREMREAAARLDDLDLVLMDTAGRSPRDEVQIQELKSILSEAHPDEVHLVLSGTSGAKSLVTTAERFAEVGTTTLLLTKLDEAASLGHLVALLRECQLPISYLTDGQHVPDDIQVADANRMADSILGVESD